MRTLDEIVRTARANEPLDPREARYALAAFDVLLAQLELDRDPVRLLEYMAAATSAPDAYIGAGNDPESADFQAWYKAMNGVVDGDTTQEG